MKVESRHYSVNGNAEKFQQKINKWKASYIVRIGSDCSEFIVEDTHYIFAKSKVFPKDKIYLFNLVKAEAQKYIESNELVLPTERKTIVYNYDFDENNKITGTDLNHAYWRIAYIHNIIKEKTYLRALAYDCKAIRLASLSCLGREKKFEKYVNGEVTNEIVKQARDEKLNDVFKFIRLFCFETMHECKELLGDDFFCYKTDCIYYKDTEENRQKVHDFFDSKNLTYKQLVY
jgi:hypothetical protein